MDSTTATQWAGVDPDYYIRDLYNSIAQGNYPTWNMSVQIMTQDQAKSFQWNPFDVTKVNRIIINIFSNYFNTLQSSFVFTHISILFYERFVIENHIPCYSQTYP